MTQPWSILGLEPTNDEGLIRKTYARLVRQFRPESHPTEFSALRQAYEAALSLARTQIASHDTHLSNPHEPAESSLQWFEASPGTSTANPTILPVRQGWDDQAALEQLRQCMDRQDNGAAVAWLIHYLAIARHSTVDAMYDFEAALAHAVLSHEAPPLHFIEACAKQLDWPKRWHQLGTMLRPAPAHRLKRLLELAQQYRFSSQHAANPWQRYLFSDPSSEMPWIGRTELLARAHGVAKAWRQSCADLNVRGHLRALNLKALLHVENNGLQLCDIYNGFFLALYVLLYARSTPTFGQMIWAVVLWCTVVFVTGCGMRLACRRARGYAHVQRALVWIRRAVLLSLALGFLGALAGRELSSVLWIADHIILFRELFLAYFVVFALWLHWLLARLFDDCALTYKLRDIDSADDQWWAHELGEDE